MAKITVDGTEVEVQDGINVIEAAKAAGVHVPHFCYHPALSTVGQCRMCLVDIEGMPKLQAGCATAIKDGMKIHVYNEKVDKARKGQMEFLLINHPLDCPICDKAGECPLQDYSFNYGSVTSRYGEAKRTYPGMDRTSIGPHVLQNMNRCIHCTRCIRFCEEITGTGELAFFKRGAYTEVGIFPGQPLENWMSACVTDICPTGALTTREFRFEARVWNLGTARSVCNGCDVGCNIFIEHRSGKIYRYKPRVNPEVNDFWLCDYGRFSHERYEVDRIVVPKVRRDDWLGVATWDEAFEAIETRLRGLSGPAIAAIASAQMTNEEAWLLKKIFVDHFASPNVDVFVDPIGPIPMKSRDAWLAGTQAGPNFRGVRNAGTLRERPDGRRSDDEGGGRNRLPLRHATPASPRARASPRSWRTCGRRSSSWSRPGARTRSRRSPTCCCRGRSSPRRAAPGRTCRDACRRSTAPTPPRGRRVEDREIFRQLGARLTGGVDFAPGDGGALFDQMRSELAAFQGLEWNEAEGYGLPGGEGASAP